MKVINMNKNCLGSNFDDFLEEEGLLQEADRMQAGAVDCGRSGRQADAVCPHGLLHQRQQGNRGRTPALQPYRLAQGQL